MLARIVFALMAAFCPLVIHAQEKLPAAEIVDRAQAAFYSAGADMKARVVMDLINADGKKRTRVLSMLRKNLPGGREQRYFLYFHEPGDVRRTAFLVWKYPEKDDDRWIFIPAVNMTRRIAARDSRSSFVGSDFSYEDISGRDLAADSHTVLREEKLGASACYVVQSTPKAAADFSRKLSWIDKTSWLPLKEEYYDAQNQLARVFTADKIEAISAGGKTYPTAVKRTMKNVQSGHRTEVVFESVSYDVGIPPDIFTERSLQQAPEKWIR
ncbi:MAG: outer membrane lipoprotein-sorting protein [Acidobacteria bacterium]|nr:outer membrane lipoprotein-sorting protein [Acidobacteriota bacterium]